MAKSGENLAGLRRATNDERLLAVPAELPISIDSSVQSRKSSPSSLFSPASGVLNCGLMPAPIKFVVWTLITESAYGFLRTASRDRLRNVGSAYVKVALGPAEDGRHVFARRAMASCDVGHRATANLERLHVEVGPLDAIPGARSLH